jgi:DNA-binding response OmpR family regulator
MNTKSIKVLLLAEDNHGDARLLREMLGEQGVHDTEFAHLECMSEAEKYLAERAVDVIVLDLGLSDAQGLEVIRRARAAAPRTPLVVLTGLDDESMAVEALQQGAQDYLIKGQIEARGLHRSLRYAIERKVLEEALFVAKERAQVTLNSIGDAVICTDISEHITFLNRVAERMTGWSWREANGRPMTEVFRILDASSRETIPNLGHHRSEHLRDGVPGRKLCRQCIRDSETDGIGPEISGVGADRERADEARRVCCLGVANAESQRRKAGHRRFRNGLLELKLSPEIPNRRAEDRPVVRAPDHHGARRNHDRHRSDQHGAQFEVARGGGGRRNPGGAGLSAGAAMRRGARILFRAANGSRGVRQVA